jgi:hypothetical protein
MKPRGKVLAVTPAEGRYGKRPVAVTFVAVLALMVGAYHLAHGVWVFVDEGSASKVAEGAFDFVLGPLAIAIGIAALRMRHWAWVAFMLWALVGLVHQLLRHFFYHDPDYVAMALGAVVGTGGLDGAQRSSRAS